MALSAAVAGLLAGCADSATFSSINPVDWWHGLEGGEIAATRPPPPDADAPYPSLGSVPAKPAAPDAAAHARIASALVADHANAVYDASIAPIPVLTPPPVRQPPTPVSGSGDSDQPNASLPAATAPPAPPSVAPAPKKAPVGEVTASSLPAPAPPAAPPAAAPAAPAAPGDAELPAIPDAPPPPPTIAGVNLPAVTAPTPPVATPPAPPAAIPPPGAPVAIPFPVGSANIPNTALAPIKLLASQRGTGSISVTGFGGAISPDPAAQAAALPLGFDRARAVAAGLEADGVPAASIRIAAQAQGEGATAYVVH